MRCLKCAGTGFIFTDVDTEYCKDCNGYGVVEDPDDD